TPAAVAVMATAYVGAAMYAVLYRNGSRSRVLQATAVVAVGAAMVALPYYALAAGDVLAYVRQVMVEDRDIWQTAGSRTFHLLYYLQPQLVSSALGWLAPCGALFALAHGAVLSSTPSASAARSGVTPRCSQSLRPLTRYRQLAPSNPHTLAA